MLDKIFKKHYSKRYAYLLDAFFLIISTEILLFLNGSNLVIRSNIDKLIYVIICLISITLFRGYVMFLRYTTFIDIGKIASGLVTTILIYSLIISANTRAHYNYLLLLFYFSLSFLSLYRLVIKLLFASISKEEKITNSLLFGAGVNGVMIKKALDDSNTHNVKGFIDDDLSKIGRSIEGKRVMALETKLLKYVSENKISQIILTTDNLKQKRKNELFNFFKDLGIKIFYFPSIDNFAIGNGILSKLKPIKIEDLLRRDEIKIDTEKNIIQYKNKNILVTGAAGSIGSEIVKQLIEFSPKNIYLMDNSELNLFNLKNELIKKKYKTKLFFLLQNITDYYLLDNFFSQNKIDVIFHAAAYKNVFMTETFPSSSVNNNILGTKSIVDFAIKYEVPNMVMISTDKAVNPSNVMGASKRIAEIYVSYKSSSSKTQIITTRFGNVLGSSGSVVQIFNEQIANGGPVTLTHPEITRFFMTITEACQLVLEAGATGSGGEIYVFDMGDPVKISDLAISMIRLSGLIENQDIEIKQTGLRPGEKLYEELLTDKENLKRSHNDLIYIADKEKFNIEKINQIDDLIELSLKGGTSMDIVKLMKKIVPEYISLNSSYESLDKKNIQ